MKYLEKGVLQESKIYFYKCSEIAQELFFYPICTGNFKCDSNYKVIRNNYSSYLFLYVLKGDGFFYNNNKKIRIHAGEFVLIDCYKPHCYGTDSNWEIVWLHFDGSFARRYVELCTTKNTINILKNNPVCIHNIKQIYNIFDESKTISEIDIFKRILSILAEFIDNSACSDNENISQNIIEQSLFYISENLSNNISIEQIATNVCLSPYYFSRIFKKETGYSPHEYLVLSRINKAKYLLKTTSMPLKEIAISCGFGNACNFSVAFKKINGNTPLVYRNENSNFDK